MSDEQDIVERLGFNGRYAAESEREAAIRRIAERKEAASLIERLRVELDAAQQVNRAYHDEMARLRHSLAKEARHD